MFTDTEQELVEHKLRFFAHKMILPQEQFLYSYNVVQKYWATLHLF